MINPITELFLQQYFLMDAVFGKHFINKNSWFKTTGKAFGLSSKELDVLFARTEDANVKSITTEKEYFRHMRVKKYMTISFIESELSDDIEELINIKGSAITLALNTGVKKLGESTATSICNDLIQRANTGNVVAMRLYAMAQLEGICFKKNANEGLRILEATSSWMDIPSIILLRKYGPDNVFASDAHLSAAVDATPYDCLASSNVKVSEEDKVLSKAFLVGTLQRETFIPQYARVLFNEHIPLNEREKLILSSGKDTVFAVAELPLDMNLEAKIAFDFTAFDEITEERENEKKQIKRNLHNSDLRMYEGYRPLCIVSDSPTVLAMYANAIVTANKSVNVTVISLSECSDQELDKTSNNIFVTACEEDAQNVFMITCFGKLADNAAESLQEFMNHTTRCAFRLKTPSVTLDLGAVLPICFCDRQNAKLLKPFCEVISVSSMNEAELKKEFGAFLNDREHKYGISKIHIDDILLSKLMQLEFDTAKAILDRAIMSLRYGDAEISLTVDSVSEFIKNAKSNYVYGFGGTVNA
jgi:hypothetical protein